MMQPAENRDFNGKTTSYAYDVLNRLLSRTPDPSFTGAPAESFTYTLTGKRATMTDASGGTTYSYTNRDRVRIKSTTLQGALSYTYDLSGNVASVVSSNANGTNVSYTWDAANQLATVMDHWTNGQTNYAFDQTGQLSNVSYPNGVKHNYTTYDTRDRLTNMNVSGPGGAIASYAQAFSFSGRKTSATETSGRTASYGYDTIYRLLSENITGDPVSANNGSLGYSLDSVGNRSSLASNLAALASQSFTYDANDRISGETFDTNGNTLTSGGHTFVYDFQDRLAQYDNTVGMVYDGDGNRVARTEGGVTHRYLIDDQTPTGYAQIAEELVPTEGVIRHYTYGTMRISQRRLIVSPNWELSYYGYDGGGSVRQLFNPSGVVTDTYAYDAFGNTVAHTGSALNEFLYRGEQFDSTLGAYYLRARYYRPQVGRFLTQDSDEGVELKPPTLKLYLYGLGDPVKNVDPSGFAVAIEAGELDIQAIKRFLVFAGSLATVGLACDLTCGDNRGRWQAQGSDMATSGGESISWNLPLPPWKIFGALDLAALMSMLSQRQLENRLDAFARAMQWLAGIVGGVSAVTKKSFPASPQQLQRYWDRQGRRRCPGGDCRIDVEVLAGRAFIF